MPASVSNRKPAISIVEMARLDRIGAVPNLNRDRRRHPLGAVFAPSNVRAGSALAAVALVVAFAITLGARLSAPPAAPSGPAPGASAYAVVFDAGSTGNRVHVFEFSAASSTSSIGALANEVFRAETPGFRAFAADPDAAAAMLDPLIETARAAVPAHLRPRTPLTLRATAGLRLLPEGPEAADAILAAARAKLEATEFLVRPDRVTLLDGADEGAFGWIAVNYLLGNDAAMRSGGGSGGGASGGFGFGGRKAAAGGSRAAASGASSSDGTVAVADLGGGSAQISFAVDAATAEAAPEGYVRSTSGDGGVHYYAHSFNGYGIMAARAKILSSAGAASASEAAEERGHPCVPAGFSGGCEGKCYGLPPDASYVAVARAEGADFEACAAAARAAIDGGEEGVGVGGGGDGGVACAASPCSFAGAWTTERRSRMVGMSYLRERASEAKVRGFPASGPAAAVTITPGDLRAAGREVCRTAAKDLARAYPEAEEAHAPYLCLDVAYAYSLLTRGFGMGEEEEITLVDKIEREGVGGAVEAAWALGDAVATMEAEAGTDAGVVKRPGGREIR